MGFSVRSNRHEVHRQRFSGGDKGFESAEAEIELRAVNNKVRAARERLLIEIGDFSEQTHGARLRGGGVERDLGNNDEIAFRRMNPLAVRGERTAATTGQAVEPLGREMEL